MRGGARDGAGRKPLENPRKRLVMYVTEEEREEVNKFLASLRTLPELLEKPKVIEISAVNSKVEEPAEINPTTATKEQILQMELDNHGMTRGKWECIAGILNRKLQYDERLEPWTATTIKKAFQKARKQAQA